MTNGDVKGQRLALAALIVSGVILGVVAISVVAAQVGAWRTARQAVLGPSTWAATPAVLDGRPAPKFLLENLAGDTLELPIPGRRHLLIVYSTTCVFCDASVRAWQNVASQVCDRAQVVLVSIQPLGVQKAYWNAQGSFSSGTCADHFPPIIGRLIDARGFAEQYGVRGTPIHFVIEEDGGVARTWRGAVGRPQAADSLLSALSLMRPRD